MRHTVRVPWEDTDLRGRRPCEDGGWHWSDAYSSKASPGTVGSCRRPWSILSIGFSGSMTLSTPWFVWLLASRIVRKQTSLVPYHPICETLLLTKKTNTAPNSLHPLRWPKWSQYFKEPVWKPPIEIKDHELWSVTPRFKCQIYWLLSMKSEMSFIPTLIQNLASCLLKRQER
jgi:hypothetical protein